MIILNDLSKTYARQGESLTALKNIHLQVKKGEIFGIIGQSGAGKSTLIRCVNLLERPTQGQVRVADQELTQLSGKELRQARRHIGMIFQHFNLLTSRTVYQNVALPLEFCGYTPSQIGACVHPLLELVGLSHKKKNYPHELSGGQKQRVAIARALAVEPHVLLSDEATSALDPETTQTILELLKNIRDQLNLTILLITHEMSVIKTCCDRVGILHQGELIESNEVGEFFTHPQTDIAKSFIASASHQNLPAPIAGHVLAFEQDSTHPLWRLRFWEKAATQPIISQLINQFNLRVNILQAHVEYIKNHAMGTMIIAVAGEKNNLFTAMHYLQSIGIQLEVMGHVPNDIIPFA